MTVDDQEFPAVVGLIQARGGSKGVPHKNTRDFCGFPLIAWSIAACRLSVNISRTILSTDDEKIAEIGRKYGAEVPFMRPSEFATDEATDFGVINHALEWLRDSDGSAPPYIAQFRPTTPLRDPRIIDSAVSDLFSKPLATSLRSISEAPESPWKMFGMEGSWLHGLRPDDDRPEYFNLPRQAFPPIYIAQGYIDIIRSETVLEKNLTYGERMTGFITPDTGEIDREEDFPRLAYNVGKFGSVIRDYLVAKYS